MKLRFSLKGHECDDDCNDYGCHGYLSASELLKITLQKLGKNLITFVYGSDPFQSLTRRVDQVEQSAARGLTKLAKATGASCNQPLNAYPHLHCTEPFVDCTRGWHKHTKPSGEVVLDGPTGAQGAQSR